MATLSPSSLIYLLGVLVFFMGTSTAQLSTTFYSNSCPNLTAIVRTTLQDIIAREARMGASILRLHFHDCFVNGCDGSILLDDTRSFTGEKNAAPNVGSVRGFEHIDTLKSNVEKACPGVVSCADILAISASMSVGILGGPTWNVKCGRRDARTASQAAANTSIPPPTSSLSQLLTSYANVGLNNRDMVALSGGHTIGQARCTTFRARIYNETPIDSNFAQTRRSTCPAAAGSGDGNLAPLDVQTPTRFDNNYYRNLMANRGLLHSDQQLFSGGSTDATVRGYVNNPNTFNSDFVAAMVKMGDISPLTGTAGEIRSNCRRTN